MDLRRSNDTDRSRWRAYSLLSLKVYWPCCLACRLRLHGYWCDAGFGQKLTYTDSVLHLPLVLPPVVVDSAAGVDGDAVCGQWLYDWFGLTFAL